MHIVWVLLICLPIIIYPPLWRYITDIGIWDLAVPAKKTTDMCVFIWLRCGFTSTWTVDGMRRVKLYAVYKLFTVFTDNDEQVSK